MPPHPFPILQDPTLLNAAPRALVYLTVEWSGPERHSRKTVQTALAALTDIPFAFFAINEDDPSLIPWLLAHGHPRHPLGAGSLLWLENGKCIATERYPAQTTPNALIRRTDALWLSRSIDPKSKPSQ